MEELNQSLGVFLFIEFTFMLDGGCYDVYNL